MTMRTAISFLALLAMSAAAATASAQTPATQASPIPATDLMTRWGKAVTPDNAWRSYPRPQLKRARWRSEEHTSELQSLMRISYAVFCLKKKKQDISYRQHRC